MREEAMRYRMSPSQMQAMRRTVNFAEQSRVYAYRRRRERKVRCSIAISHYDDSGEYDGKPVRTAWDEWAGAV